MKRSVILTDRLGPDILLVLTMKRQVSHSDSDTSNKDIFETLLVCKSKWTPPEGQFASLYFFTKKCRHDIHKLKFNRNTKFSNLSSEEWAALKNLSKRNDIVVKSADKGGAVVVWRSDLYQKEALRQLSDTSFYAKIPKDLTSKNQKLVKDTVQNLIVNQELPDTATNLIINPPRTSCIYFLPKIHKPNNPLLRQDYDDYRQIFAIIH